MAWAMADGKFITIIRLKPDSRLVHLELSDNQIYFEYFLHFQKQTPLMPMQTLAVLPGSEGDLWPDNFVLCY